MFFDVENHATLQRAVNTLCEFLLAQNVSSDDIFDSKLVACELLGNVLRHANGKARLCGEIKDGFLELKILSDSPFYPLEKQPCAEVYSEHGRGLFLVRSVCEERVFVDEDGIRVLIKINR
ncbi:MAG: ATP-binding protein [Clostridia bacterium]|nr:ATP-binding protein [Clostridia bacterium]